jgi:hypothetical protein
VNNQEVTLDLDPAMPPLWALLTGKRLRQLPFKLARPGGDRLGRSFRRSTSSMNRELTS